MRKELLERIREDKRQDMILNGTIGPNDPLSHIDSWNEVEITDGVKAFMEKEKSGAPRQTQEEYVKSLLQEEKDGKTRIASLDIFCRGNC